MTVKSHLPYIIAGATGALLASFAPLLLTSTQADTKLLPFQGRLTDAAGSAIADGAKVVEFKMYDAPTGGNVKWAGEVHKLSVNGGLVNTMLGSKAGLGSVDFSTPTYLQITVDANTDNQITAADPPLLPRQSVIGAVYASEAGNSRQLGNHPAAEYAAVFASADPSSGQLDGSKIKPLTLPGSVLSNDSIAAGQIGENAITSSELADNSVTSSKIADGEVAAPDLADDSVTFPKSSPRAFAASPTAALGQMARSADLPSTVNATETAANLGTVTLTTRGGPVFLGLVSSSSGSAAYLKYINTLPGATASASVRIQRPGRTVFRHVVGGDNLVSSTATQLSFYVPVGSVWGIDNPPAGTHTYTLQIYSNDAGESSVQLVNAQIIAYEIR